MSTALLIVDYQNDFINGSLAVPDGAKAQLYISRLARSEEVDHIFLSRDWHPADHVSFSDKPEYKDYSWPPHCVQGTEGAEFDSILMESLTDLPKAIVTKGTNPKLEAYSAFDGTTPVLEEEPYGSGDATYEAERSLGPVLEQVYGVSKVIVVGLALDYCVKATALDAVYHGFETSVVIDATRPVAYETGAEAIAELVEAGVEVERTL